MSNQLVSKVKEMFDKGEIDFKEIGNEFPKLGTHFDKARPGKINRYDNGVMSVVMNGFNKQIPSTFGYLPEGDFDFNTGTNQETMYFLMGDLSWSVKGENFVTPKRYDELVIPVGKDLILSVRDPSLYICDYSKGI